MNNLNSRNTLRQEVFRTKQKGEGFDRTFAFSLRQMQARKMLCSAIVNRAHAIVISAHAIVNYMQVIVNTVQFCVIPAHPIVNCAFGFVVCTPVIINASQPSVV